MGSVYSLRENSNEVEQGANWIALANAAVLNGTFGEATLLSLTVECGAKGIKTTDGIKEIQPSRMSRVPSFQHPRFPAGAKRPNNAVHPQRMSV